MLFPSILSSSMLTADAARRVRRVLLTLSVPLAAAALTVGVFRAATTLAAPEQAGVLEVEIRASHNLVVDSNVESPSTYAPSVATVIGRFCNTGGSALTDVQGFIGDFAGDAPGSYPSRDSSTAAFQTEHPHLSNTGLYSFTHVGGRAGLADATRFMGTLAAGECKTQYWHFTYPRRGNPDNSGSAVWGVTNDPDDDLWLEFDVWSTSAEGSSDSATRRMTMRNEISAMANKIEPQGGMWFNTESDTVRPGELITSNGVRYDLGVINKGFDNDGDFVPDYNAWLQPVGDPDFDPSCFRLVRTTGVITVSRSGGQPDLILPFEDQLYFSDLPDDNNGAIGNVHYTFLALDGPCTTRMTPYQEVASGFDNEKFNADFGTELPNLGSSEPEVASDKVASPDSVALGGTVTYQIPFTNTSTASAGLPSLGVPLTISDTIPSGLEYVAGSAGATLDFSPNSGVTILYSTDDGVTWSTTEPSPASSVTTLQWRLNDPLPAGESGSATFQALVPSGYSGSTFIENADCLSFGSATCFDEDTAYTMVAGSNSIGDLVWRDDDADGLADTGEPGLAGVNVRLYWDANGDGALDDGDVLLATEQTDGIGNYSFDSLPDADFLVTVDLEDPDVPTGFDLTTDGVVAVTGLGTATTSPFLDADFGLAPVLTLDKALVSSDPAYEGEDVVYTITLSNTRPGDGTGQAQSCTYDVWAEQEASQSSTQPDNKRFSNSTTGFVPPTNAFGASGPDDAFASASFATGANNVIAGAGYSVGPQSGAITSVEARFRIYLDTALSNDTAEGKLFFNGAQQGTTRAFTTNELNAFQPQSNVGLLTWDVTALRTWDWSDFTGDLDLQFGNQKSGAADPGRIFMDAIGFRVTTDEQCGGPDDAIATLPVSDTYNADLLQLVSATPTPDATTTGGSSPYANTGQLDWTDLGPLYAGGTKTITVTFRALEPPDTDADGEPDPTTLPNDAQSAGGTYPSGRTVNDASDTVNSTLNPAGTIGDLIWNDIDGDGVYEPNGADGQPNTADDERGIPDVTVELQDGSCTPGADCQTTTTDADGLYSFDAVRDGSYTVVVDTSTLPDGGTGATNTSDRDGDNDSDSGTLTINNSDGSSANDDVLDADFGYSLPAVIEGTIWHDYDQSATGTPDRGEEGLAGVTVYADDGICAYPPGSGGLTQPDCQTATTDANGEYTITGLTPGSGTTYTVRVDTATLPSGTWSQTYDDPNGPDGVPGTGDDTVALDDAVPVTVVQGGRGEADFSYVETGSTSVGDTLYADWDGDAVQDVDEEGLPDVTVRLYEDSDGDGVVDPEDALIGTTTTDASGVYQFGSLPGDTYIVVVDESDPDLPSAYIQTADPDETGVCSTCDAMAVADTTGGSVSDIDFGYQPAGVGSIGDLVWRDDDGDGHQGPDEPGLADITVTLYEDTNGDGAIDTDDAVVATAVTDADGGYTFDGLAAGDYLVQVDTADVDLPTDGNGAAYVLSAGGDPAAVTLASAETRTDVDFGFTAGGTIGDFIWQDNDGDGSQDPEEPGIADVTVSLYDDVNGNGVFDSGTDTLVDTAVTDADGRYTFTSLAAGDYVVVVDTADPDLPSSTVTGDPDEIGACSTCDGESAVSLAAGAINLSRDFGFQTLGVVGDTLWIDTDGDGVHDADESGIPYVTVELQDGTCTPGSTCPTTVTDSEGFYSFGNLADGSYTVVVDTADPDFPAGLTQTFDPDETGTCTTCDNQGSVTVSGGSSDLTIDFGYQYNGAFSISGTVFHDDDSSGTHDEPGESTTYANVTVRLYNSDGLLVATTTTNASGDYTFGSLPDGDYTVSVNDASPALDGLDATTATFLAVTISGASVTGQDFGFVSTLDFGDLPDSYGTRVEDEGARHTVGALRLGSALDTDPDGQSSTNVDGDDSDGTDDEDGVVANNWSAGENGGSVSVTVSGCSDTCYLSGWVDWNQDGDFDDAGEHVLLDRAVTDGSQTVTFDIPDGTTFGTTYNTRFRLYESSTQGGATPTGFGGAGEVEDHAFAFNASAVTLVRFEAKPSGSPGARIGWLLAVLLGAAVVARRRWRASCVNPQVANDGRRPDPARVRLLRHGGPPTAS